MKNNKQQQLDKKTEFKIYLLILSILTIIITLDYLNIGLPCFITN
jgi:hypothetical protein